MPKQVASKPATSSMKPPKRLASSRELRSTPQRSKGASTIALRPEANSGQRRSSEGAPGNRHDIPTTAIGSGTAGAAGASTTTTGSTTGSTIAGAAGAAAAGAGA